MRINAKISYLHLKHNYTIIMLFLGNVDIIVIEVLMSLPDMRLINVRDYK